MLDECLKIRGERVFEQKLPEVLLSLNLPFVLDKLEGLNCINKRDAIEAKANVYKQNTFQNNLWNVEETRPKNAYPDQYIPKRPNTEIQENSQDHLHYSLKLYPRASQQSTSQQSTSQQSTSQQSTRRVCQDRQLVQPQISQQSDEVFINNQCSHSNEISSSKRETSTSPIGQLHRDKNPNYSLHECEKRDSIPNPKKSSSRSSDSVLHGGSISSPENLYQQPNFQSRHCVDSILPQAGSHVWLDSDQEQTCRKQFDSMILRAPTAKTRYDGYPEVIEEQAPLSYGPTAMNKQISQPSEQKSKSNNRQQSPDQEETSRKEFYNNIV